MPLSFTTIHAKCLKLVPDFVKAILFLGERVKYSSYLVLTAFHRFISKLQIVVKSLITSAMYITLSASISPTFSCQCWRSCSLAKWTWSQGHKTFFPPSLTRIGKQLTISIMSLFATLSLKDAKHNNVRPWEVWTVRIDLVPMPNKLFYSSLMLKKGLSFAYL